MIAAAPVRASRTHVQHPLVLGDADTPAGRERERVVTSLCTKLAAQGVEVIRDQTHAEVGSRISEFIRQLAASDFVIVVISERYLKSYYCMWELFQIYRNCGDHSDPFLERIIPIVLPDARIATLRDRAQHGIYWKHEHETLKPLIEELGVHNLGSATLIEYQRISDFARHVTEILTLVIDRLIPRDFERMQSEDFREILELIKPTKRT